MALWQYFTITANYRIIKMVDIVRTDFQKQGINALNTGMGIGNAFQKNQQLQLDRQRQTETNEQQRQLFGQKTQINQQNISQQERVSGMGEMITALNLPYEKRQELFSELEATKQNPDAKKALAHLQTLDDEEQLATMLQMLSAQQSGGIPSGPKVGKFRFIETDTGIAKLNTATGEIEEKTLTSKEHELARKQTADQLKIDLKSSASNFDRSKKIRDRHDKLSGEFIKVRDSFDRIKASEKTAAGDLALIFNYMKMLDPGSVVREGEFATAQNTAGVPDRLRNVFNRLLSGERLSPKQRKSFISQAGKLFNTAENRNKSLIKGTISIGAQFGVTEDNIFGAQNESSVTRIRFDAQGNQI